MPGGLARMDRHRPRTFYMLLTFLAGIIVNYRAVASLRQVQFLGESVTVFRGVPNPLMAVRPVCVLLMLIFVADASVTAWRRGDRRKARMVGGSVVFFVLAGLVRPRRCCGQTFRRRLS